MSPQLRAFRPLAASQTLAVTSASQQITLNYTLGTRSLRIMNSGTDTIYVHIRGDGAATATVAASMPMLPNSIEVFFLPLEVTVIAVIGLAGGTSNIITTVGEGL